MRSRTIIFFFSLTLIILSACHQVKAQEMEGKFAIRGGFYLGNDFTNGASRTHLEGFEIGGDIPLTRNLKGVGGVLLCPTLVFGGSNRKGADTDGNIYRVMIVVKRGFGNHGFYGGLGLGGSFTGAHQNQFKDVSGITGQVMAGYLFNSNRQSKVDPFVEASYFAGSDAKLSGFSFNAGVRF